MRVLVIGLLMSVTGMAWDSYWHSQGIPDDAYFIFPPHVLLIIGFFVAAEGARREYAGAISHRRWALGVSAIAAATAGLARTYDEILHLQNIDSSMQNVVAHSLGLIGLLLLIVGTAFAWRLGGSKSMNGAATTD